MIGLAAIVFCGALVLVVLSLCWLVMEQDDDELVRFERTGVKVNLPDNYAGLEKLATEYNRTLRENYFKPNLEKP